MKVWLEVALLPIVYHKELRVRRVRGEMHQVQDAAALPVVICAVHEALRKCEIGLVRCYPIVVCLSEV